MAKFCGICGKEAEDSASVCGNCGTTFIPEVVHKNPEKKDKKVLKMIGGITGTILVLAMLAYYIAGFFGVKGIIRNVANAYEKEEAEQLVPLMSKYWSTYYEKDEELEKIIENWMEKDIIYFKEQVGSPYRITYQVERNREINSSEMKDMKDWLSGYQDYDGQISEAREVKIQLLAKGKGEAKKVVTLRIIKENGWWKILEFDMV